MFIFKNLITDFLATRLSKASRLVTSKFLFLYQRGNCLYKIFFQSKLGKMHFENEANKSTLRYASTSQLIALCIKVNINFVYYLVLNKSTKKPL